MAKFLVSSKTASQIYGYASEFFSEKALAKNWDEMRGKLVSTTSGAFAQHSLINLNREVLINI